MNNRKSLPMALTVLGLGAVSSFAEIKVGDNLSLSGFLDMSISGAADTADATLGAAVDQFEVDFMYKYDKVSARVDINALPSGSSRIVTSGGDTVAIPNTGVSLEQGFVTYTPGALSLSAGRFLSTSGFEAAEPTGLYQYSTSKALFYGGYQNGVNVNFNAGVVNLYAAVVSDLWNPGEFDLANNPGFEGQVALTPAEGITAKVTYLYQMFDEDAVGDASQQLLNTWASFAAGPITAAAEYSLLLDWEVPEGDGDSTVNDGMGHAYLAMVNFKFNNFFAATLRHSANILGDGEFDSEVTFSPSVTLTPQWLTLAEVRYDFLDEVTKYAVESLFMF